MIRALTLALCLANVATSSAAQSLYGCMGVEEDHDFASVEGEGGAFFRLRPDLQMWHPLGDVTVERLAALSETLAAGGTTLVYVPLPVRTLAMPDRIPVVARDYGFDAVMAATVHDLDEVRLREAGIVVPAVRKALRTGGATPPSFHLTDYRMTAEGADRLAKAIADAISGVEALSAVPRAQFQTQPAADAVVTESVMRAALQRHCAQELPPALVQATVTQRLAGAAASGEAAIFGGTGVSARIAVVGTEHIGDPGLNLTGALSQATGLDAIIYTVDGGGAFGAISSYMTSRAFQEQRPAVLVWVNPVENNLATFGDQPLAELTVAAGDTCRIALPVLTGSDAQGVTADLSGLSAGQGFVLFVDAEGTPATEARFDFRGQDGLSRSFWVVRNPDQVPTGRFYLPMSGVGDAVVTAVDVRFDVPVSGVVRMAACNG